MYDPLREYRAIQLAMRQGDAVREYQKMQSAVQMADPLREYRKMQSAVQMADPLREYRKMQSAVQMADPLREYRKMQSAVQTADPLREYRKMQSAVQMADPLREYRKMQSAVQTADPLREYRKMQSAVEMVDPLREYRKIQTDIRKLAEAISGNATFKHTRELLNALSSSANLYRSMSGHAFNSTSLAIAVENLGSTTDLFTSEPSNIAASISEVLGAVRRGIRTGIIDRLGLEFYLGLLITLLFTLAEIQLGNQSEKRIISEITQTREQILDEFEKRIIQAPDLNTYYVVQRAVQLRRSPKGDAMVVGVLYPNQLTRLVENKGKWIRVEYFDHFSGIHRSGWCYKKYLVRVSTSRPE